MSAYKKRLLPNSHAPALSGLAADLTGNSRRRFLQFMAASPLLGYLAATGRVFADQPQPAEPTGTIKYWSVENISGMKQHAHDALDEATWAYIEAEADDGTTRRLNRNRFDAWQIRARRLVDVSKVDLSRELLGLKLASPIILAPAAWLGYLHHAGEPAVARAAGKHLQILSMLSTHPIEEVAAAGTGPLWFQVFPVRDRGVMRAILQRAEAAGTTVMVLTVDSPVAGNREGSGVAMYSRRLVENRYLETGNFAGIAWKGEKKLFDPSLTWDFIDWLRDNSTMQIVVKGIVTHEDARMCLTHGVDGIIVSNHGGRQEESGRATIDSLKEVVQAVRGDMPVLIDGGFRRGTHVFKALALGATAVCIGRPYLWGLGAFGQEGVAQVLDILNGELTRIMQLSGTPSLAHITNDFVDPRI